VADGAKAPGDGELSEVVRRVGAVHGECAKRNNARVAGKTGQDEPVDGLADRPGYQFHKASGVAVVGTLESP
jgi:hypothetical protein